LLRCCEIKSNYPNCPAGQTLFPGSVAVREAVLQQSGFNVIHHRTLTPASKFTRRQIAARERDSGYEEGLESALRYDPTVPLAHLLLAEFEENPQRAAFLRAYALKRLPDDAPSGLAPPPAL
jgi:hypothetical protein